MPKTAAVEKKKRGPKPMYESGMDNIAVRLPTSDVEILEAAANSRGVRLSQLLREIVHESVQRLRSRRNGRSK